MKWPSLSHFIASCNHFLPLHKIFLEDCLLIFILFFFFLLSLPVLSHWGNLWIIIEPADTSGTLEARFFSLCPSLLPQMTTYYLPDLFCPPTSGTSPGGHPKGQIFFLFFFYPYHSLFKSSRVKAKIFTSRWHAMHLKSPVVWGGLSGVPVTRRWLHAAVC